jgi:hypothetical protein
LAAILIIASAVWCIKSGRGRRYVIPFSRKRARVTEREPAVRLDVMGSNRKPKKDLKYDW